MTRPTQAKYCPRCHVMNFVDAATCSHCGHGFRTGVPTPPPTDDAAKGHKTQMFVLPPVLPRAEAPRMPIPEVKPESKFSSLLSSARMSPLLPAIALLLIVIIALVYWGISTLR